MSSTTTTTTTTTTNNPVSIYKTSIITRALHRMDSSSKHTTRPTGNLTEASINVSPRRIRKERHTNVTSLSVTLKEETSLTDIVAALSLFPNTQSLTVVFDFSYDCSSFKRPADLPRLSTVLPHLRSLRLVGFENIVGEWIADTCLGLTDLVLQDTLQFFMLRHRQPSSILDTLLSSNKSTLKRFDCVSDYGFPLNLPQLTCFMKTLNLDVPPVYNGFKISGANVIVRRSDDRQNRVNLVQLFLSDKFDVAITDYRSEPHIRASVTIFASGGGTETTHVVV